MYKILILFAVVLGLGSCEKTKQVPLNDPLPENSIEIATGNFVSGVHPTSGIARIVQSGNTQTLVLERFSTDAGPDLKVYLAVENNASQFIQLGNLKSTTGTQNYPITGMPDIKKYKYVLIWCQEFGVLFGAAEIR